MRQSVFHSAAMVVFMLLVLNANLSAETATRSTASNWAVISHPARLVNGSPVLFRVTTPKPVSALSGNWLGHDIEFSFDAGHKMWFAPVSYTHLHTAATELLDDAIVRDGSSDHLWRILRLSLIHI